MSRFWGGTKDIASVTPTRIGRRCETCRWCFPNDQSKQARFRCGNIHNIARWGPNRLRVGPMGLCRQWEEADG